MRHSSLGTEAAGRSPSQLGRHFPLLFVAVLLQETASALLVHIPGYFSLLGATEGTIGLLYGCAAVLALTMRPGLARVLDLRPRQFLLAAGMVNILLISLLAAGTAWGPFLWTLFLVQRVVHVAVFTTMLTYGSDLIPAEHRTRGLALYGLAGLLSISTGGLLSDVLIPRFGFNGVLALTALLSASSMWVVSRLPTVAVAGSNHRRSFWATLRQRSLLPLWLGSSLFSIGLVTLFTFVRTFAESRGVATAGVFFLCYGLMAAVTRVADARLFGRLSNRRVVTASLVMYATGIAILTFAFSRHVFVLGAAVAGVAHGVLFPALTSEAVSRARSSERGAALATMTTTGDIALLTTAPLVGAGIDNFGYMVAFLATALVISMGSVVFDRWDRGSAAQGLVSEPTG